MQVVGDAYIDRTDRGEVLHTFLLLYAQKLEQFTRSNEICCSTESVVQIKQLIAIARRGVLFEDRLVSGRDVWALQTHRHVPYICRQLVVVPLRVNVNLKATTVEDLVERRKVVF